MSRIVRILPLLLVSLIALACADAAKHLRAQPAWFIDPKIDKKLVIPLAPLDKDGTPIRDAAPDEKIEIQCVRTPRGENTAPTESTDVSQCLYESIDMRDVLRVPIRNSAERNRMVHLLMNVSNDNCSTFLMRAFAQKAGNEATRNTLKDFATAVASGTARVAAVASANLGIASLFTTTAVDNVNNAYYGEKTFQVMAMAIGSERDKARTTLFSHATPTATLAEYPYFEALEDWHEYDDSCSLRRGLESLAAAANSQKTDSATALDRVRTPKQAPPNKTTAVAAADINNQQ